MQDGNDRHAQPTASATAHVFPGRCSTTCNSLLAAHLQVSKHFQMSRFAFGRYSDPVLSRVMDSSCRGAVWITPETITVTCRQLPLIVTVFVVCGVTLGFLLGFFVHKVYRAWIDVEAEDMRRQFQTLYADPLTEIDDLPTDWPKCDTRNSLKVPSGTGYVVLSDFDSSNKCLIALS